LHAYLEEIRMIVDKLSAGKNVPDEINVIIEIPANAAPVVKYEMDKETGAMFVDRFVNSAMFYPCNYGFVPHTLSEDGDPVDVLVVTPEPLIVGCVITCRPLGVLQMTDEKGPDAKIIAVPTSDVTKVYDEVKTSADLPENLMAQIGHFFEQYKALEAGKWVKVEGWGDIDEARKEILSSIERYAG
jgi:inorganic pyrophosphatase